MNSRERFMNCLRFRPVDRIPDMEFGAWNDNFPVWQKQGMPDWVRSNNEFDTYFQLETAAPGPPMAIDLYPGFKYEVLEENERTRIVRDSSGAIAQESKVGSTIPHFIEFPVKNMEDWLKIKEERYNIDTPERFAHSDDEWQQVPPNVKNYEPVEALRGGVDGLKFIRPIIAGARDVLDLPGQLVLEIAASQKAAALKLADAAGLSNPHVLADHEGLPRVLVAEND